METKAHTLSRQFAINFHFTRQCNYSCSFCFHAHPCSKRPKVEHAKQVLRDLTAAGMSKINFAGGEPLLFPDFLGELVVFCKKELGLTVSIISNGSLLTEEFVDKYKAYIDMFGLSLDSQRDDVHQKTGRGERGGARSHVDIVRSATQILHQYGVLVKINTVVHALNCHEDMSELMAELQPHRWKCLQLLLLENENGQQPVSPTSPATAEEHASTTTTTHRNNKPAKRGASGSELQITGELFNAFCARHKHIRGFVAEDNALAQNSYVILDEELRLLNCQSGSKVPTRTLLEIPANEALARCGFDMDAFNKRGGLLTLAPRPATARQYMSVELDGGDGNVTHSHGTESAMCDALAAWVA